MSAAGWDMSSAWGSSVLWEAMDGAGLLGDDEHLLTVPALRQGADDAFQILDEFHPDLLGVFLQI